MDERKKIAKWLYDKIMAEGEVYQSDTVQEIYETFGEQYTYENENGNLAIDTGVTREFRKLNSGEIVWDSGPKCWCVEAGADIGLIELTENSVELEALIPEIDPSLLATELPEADASNSCLE